MDSKTANKPDLKVYRIDGNVAIPHYATTGSAGFELQASFIKTPVRHWNDQTGQVLELKEDVIVNATNDGKRYIDIYPGYRYLVSTGLIFDIPEHFVLKVYSRSGMALKRGIQLANSVGVIDSDYVDPTGILILSDTPTRIFEYERIAQGCLEHAIPCSIKETYIPPAKKTDRNGGFGSTGV